MHTVEDVIRVAISVPLGDPNDPNCMWGLPLLIWGNPGIGKSSRIKKLAALLQTYAGVVLPAGRLPEDFAGLAVQDGKGGVNLVSILMAVRELVEIGEGILFLDEINTARSAVQSTLLGVVLDRRSGDVEIPGKVRIIAAANPVETSAGGHPLEAPLANRFIHYEMDKPTAREWGNYVLGVKNEEEDVTPLYDIETKIKENWARAWLEVAPVFVGYAERFPKALEDIPDAGSTERSKAFPTARTMEWAVRAATTCRILNIGGQLESVMLKACIGAGARDEFLAYRRDLKLPSPKQVLSEGFEPDKRLDRNYVVYISLAAYITGLPHKQAQVDAVLKAWPILQRGCEAGFADLVYPAAVELVNKNLSSLGGEKLAKASEPVIGRFGDRLMKNAKKIYDYNKNKEAV